RAGDAGNGVDADLCFAAGLVRKPGWAREIADRMDARLVRPQPLVDDDVPALDANARALEIELFGVALDTRRDEQTLGADVFAAAGNRDSEVELSFGERRHACTDDHADALLLQRTTHRFGDFGILVRKNT